MSLKDRALSTVEIAKDDLDKDQVMRREASRRAEVRATFNKALKVLAERFDVQPATVILLDHSSTDSYATSVKDLIYVLVENNLELKVETKNEPVFSVLSGGLYREFDTLGQLGQILAKEGNLPETVLDRNFIG